MISKKSLVLLVVGVIVYVPSWFNGFVWDDEEQIVNNPFVKSFATIGSVFSGSTFGGGGVTAPTGGYYKPLMSVWYMINHALFGDWPGGYHLTQSLLHSVNAVLLFLILKALTKREVVAFVAALGWLIHPGNVESVSYAASAQEVLTSFFGLLAFWVVALRTKLFRDEILGLFVGTVLILFALLSKEAGAVFPLVIMAYLLIVEGNRRAAYFYGLMLLPVILAYAVLRFGIAQVHIEPNMIIPVAQLGFGERMLTVVETLWQHIRVTFAPVYLYIGHHQVVREFGMRTLWQLGVIAALLIGMMWTNVRHSSRLGWFFFVWLVLATGLVSNVYPLDMTYAERWSYMPIAAMIGWGAAIAVNKVGSKKKEERGEKKTPRFLFLIHTSYFILLCLLVGRNVLRQAEWRDGLTLFGTDIRYAQASFDLENNYGVELIRVGRMEEAKIHFERSMELSPRWWTPPNNLGVVHQRLGDEAKAAELYRLSIKNGEYFLAYENLAMLLVKQNDAEAVAVVEAGLKRFPYNRRLLELAHYLSRQ